MTRRVAFKQRGRPLVAAVTVQGEPDCVSALIMDIKDVDTVVRNALERLDSQASSQWRDATDEQMAVALAREVRACLPPAATLIAVRIETAELESVMASSDNCETVLVTRAYEFAASHRLYNPDLTEEENVALFGKCANPHGHGHNYVLEVTVTGPIDARTGGVVDGARLDEIVEAEIVERYDHKHFNYDVPELDGLIPSSEVIVRTIWTRLRDLVPAPARLRRIVLRETPRNIFEYGEEDS